MFGNNAQIRVRFAPSPTGPPHLGNIRTALFAWLFARHSGGQFILRVEDTDQERRVEGSLEAILEALDWLSIDIDEGVMRSKKEKVKRKKEKEEIIEVGEYGPYFQSKRLAIYQKYAKELIVKEKAFYCFCGEDRLKQLRSRQVKDKLPPHYDNFCLTLKSEEVARRLEAKANRVIRMRIPEEGETSFIDAIRGEIKVANKLLDSQVLLKSDCYPTYHLAVVVDDYLMKISHVLRAEEWLPSTPKHVLLYDYFGWDRPVFVHLPVVLGPDKSKLSKRHGALSALEFRQQGYLADALINYLALLGWNPKNNQEIFTRQELVEQFALEKINKASPIFDIAKLNWLNKQYIKNMPVAQLAGLISSGKTRASGSLLTKAAAMAQGRMEKLTDFDGLTDFLFSEKLDYDSKILITGKSDKKTTERLLTLSLKIIEQIKGGEWTAAKLRPLFFKYIEDNNLRRGDMLWPLRAALTGLAQSPDLFDVLEALGRQESEKRIQQAIKKL